MAPKKSRALRGIRPWKSGWQASVRLHQGPGGLRSKSFPLETAIATMRKWREDEVDRCHAGITPVKTDSFGADVTTYLKRVTSMPTYKQQAAHLAMWEKALGRDRPRRSITATEIDVVLQDWLKAPPPTTPAAPGTKGRPISPDGLSPSTVRKRRRTLMSLFVKLDGKQAVNPVKATTNPPPSKPEARSLDYGTIARVLAQMRDRRDVKKGTLPKPSLAKLRATVIAYTGLPPAILKRVQKHDLNLAAATVRARPRRKGHGVEARTLPLIPEGLAAFAAFDAADAYGSFATQSLNRSFQKACAKAGVDPKTVSLYDLRHSFLTELYRVTKDLATVARFGLHSEGSPITARYAKGANEAVDVAAAVRLGAALKAARTVQARVVAAARGKVVPLTVVRLKKAQ